MSLQTEVRKIRRFTVTPTGKVRHLAHVVAEYVKLKTAKLVLRHVLNDAAYSHRRIARRLSHPYRTVLTDYLWLAAWVAWLAWLVVSLV